MSNLGSNLYKDGIDYCFYDGSSNVLASICIDNDDDYKTLKVIYKGGRQYVYSGVDVNDYILFKNDAISVAKALNKYIIKNPKNYECERIEDISMEELKALQINLGLKKEESVEKVEVENEQNSSSNTPIVEDVATENDKNAFVAFLKDGKSVSTLLKGIDPSEVSIGGFGDESLFTPSINKPEVNFDGFGNSTTSPISKIANALRTIADALEEYKF